MPYALGLHQEPPDQSVSELLVLREPFSFFLTASHTIAVCGDPGAMRPAMSDNPITVRPLAAFPFKIGTECNEKLKRKFSTNMTAGELDETTIPALLHD